MGDPKKAIIMRVVTFISLTTILFSSVVMAQGTPADKDACEPDAYRLCDDAVPDAVAVEKCLRSHMKSLSSACKKRFTVGDAKSKN